jgi:hypothetical protein
MGRIEKSGFGFSLRKIALTPALSQREREKRSQRLTHAHGSIVRAFSQKNAALDRNERQRRSQNYGRKKSSPGAGTIQFNHGWTRINTDFLR